MYVNNVDSCIYLSNITDLFFDFECFSFIFFITALASFILSMFLVYVFYIL